MASLLYPCACHLCQRPFHAVRPPDICAACRNGLRIRGTVCLRCGQPASRLCCNVCEEQAPSFRNTYALCLYVPGKPGHEALRRWKFGGERNTGRALARSLARELAPRIGPIDGIVPIPGRRLAAARRGFDTAHLLAEVLADRLPALGPIYPQFLCRHPHWNRGRAASRRRARRAITTTLYGPGAAPIPKGARLLLVDDIMTSQASARRCSDILLAGGAARIDVAVIGRTPHSKSKSASPAKAEPLQPPDLPRSN